MQAKVVLLIAVGLVMVVASATGTLFFVREAEKRVADVNRQLQAYGDLVSLPVPAHSVARGDVLKAGDFAQVELPRKFLPQGVLAELPPVPEGPAPGYMALADLAEGRLLLPLDLAVTTGGGQDDEGLSVADPDVIVFSPANLQDIRAGLKSGALVDVFWTRNIGGGTTETRLLGERLRVISVLSVDGGEAGGARLMVGATPETVARLLQAQRQGPLHVALSGGISRRSEGEVVVGDDVLQALPLVRREGGGTLVQEGAQEGEKPLTDMLREAVDTRPEDELCSLAVVRSASRSVIQIPCE